MPDPHPGYSYHLGTSRRFGPLRTTLRMASDLGYMSVEGTPDMLSDAASIARLEVGLGAAGLSMPTCHITQTQLRAAPRRTAAMARRLGVHTVFVGASTGDKAPRDADDWFLLGSRMRRYAEALRAAGLTVGWHNQTDELAPVEAGASGLSILFDTDRDLAWQIDVGAMALAEQPLTEWMARHGERITAAHLRDLAKPGDNLREDGWADLGKGTVDLHGLLSSLRSRGVNMMVMAHANPSDDERFAARAIATVRRMDQMLVPALDTDPTLYPKPARKQACMWMTP
ncbi:MAG: sugar phosphate isomerase/epimerase [Pseudomonadota bacterium]